jgi:hypothetical protein
MKLETKYDIGNTIYYKSEYGGVCKGTVSAIALDTKAQPKEYQFIYLIWASDRRDNGGHHVWVYEHNMGRDWESAYYDANKKLPWNILDKDRIKDMYVMINEDQSERTLG